MLKALGAASLFAGHCSLSFKPALAAAADKCYLAGVVCIGNAGAAAWVKVPITVAALAGLILGVTFADLAAGCTRQTRLVLRIAIATGCCGCRRRVAGTPPQSCCCCRWPRCARTWPMNLPVGGSDARAGTSGLHLVGLVRRGRGQCDDHLGRRLRLRRDGHEAPPAKATWSGTPRSPRTRPSFFFFFFLVFFCVAFPRRFAALRQRLH